MDCSGKYNKISAKPTFQVKQIAFGFNVAFRDIADISIRIGRKSLMRRDRCHSGGFLLRIMPPSWRPVPACTPRLCCRRAILRCRNGPTQADRSTLRLRPYAGGTVLLCCDENWNRTRHRSGNDLPQAELFYFATKKIGIGRSNVAATNAVGGQFYLPARWRSSDS